MKFRFETLQLSFGLHFRKAILLAGIMLQVWIPSQLAFAEIEDDSTIIRDLSTALEWQKVNLEDRLQSKLIRAINPAIPGKHFIVNVSIQLKLRPTPIPSPTPKATPKPQESVSGAVAVKAESSRPSLGKLDIDAPLYPESRNENPEAKALARSLEEEETNIFKNIKKITVSVILDNAISESKKELVKKILTNTTTSLGMDPPELTIDQAELVTIEPLDLKKWLFDLKQPIGFLLVSLIMSAVVIFVFNGHRKIEARRLSVLEAKNSREEVESQVKLEREATAAERAAASTAGEAVGVGGTEDEPSLEGFDKFKALLDESPEKASALVKQWLKAPVRGAGEALAVLPQVLSTEEFLIIFKYLSLEDRKVWRKLLGTTVDKRGLSTAANFVFSQIVESMLVSPPTIDEELRGMISELTINECIEIAVQDSTLGGLLVNLLPTMEVGRMFSLMNPELANVVTIASLKFSDDEIKAKSGQLKASISRQRKQKKPKAPFVDSAEELFRHIGPEKENTIFGALIESQEFDVLDSAAHKYFPSELLFKLPPRVLKVCMDRMPLAKRAEFILSNAEGDRNILLDSIGKVGSKLRDVIEVEIQEAQADDVRLRRVERNRSILLKEFLEIVRAVIKTNKAAEEQAEGVIDQWLFEKTGRRLSGAQ
ncbi:MAG: hypothetical protein ABIQ95_07180 [Bdellovibrionia bacterium]